jgi:hypothetical protein
MEARWKQTVSNPPQDASIPAQSHCFFLNGVAVPVPLLTLRAFAVPVGVDLPLIPPVSLCAEKAADSNRQNDRAADDGIQKLHCGAIRLFQSGGYPNPRPNAEQYCGHLVKPDRGGTPVRSQRHSLE